MKYRNLSLIFMVLLTLKAFYITAQEMIWLEAEDFDDLGGWTKDWQFMDQMGSPYIFSIGYGSPVEQARTQANVPKPGYYRLWVRTHDWLTDYHPGQFKVEINQNQSGKVFGRSGEEDWVWEDGGVFYLEDKLDVRINDMTGYYGRCDAIVFSSDTIWVPPFSKEDIAPLRIQYGPISQQIRDAGQYDVVVVGGGIAGTLAAVAAAREGAKTALIQNRGTLGGNSSHEIMVPPVGSVKTLLSDEEKSVDPRETGLIEEVATYGEQVYFQDGKQFPVRLLRLAESEPNLDLHLYTHMTDVEMGDDSNISSVLAIQVQTNERLRFSGKLFIDCTGNGVVGLKSGAEIRYGKESKDMHNETKAVDEADSATLGSSLKYWHLKAEEPQTFTAPPWIYSLPNCSDFGEHRHPSLDRFDAQWMIELGGTDKTYTNAEDVRDQLFRLIYGIWDHVKNHCLKFEGQVANERLTWVSHVVGVRESYRLIGDYVLSERDITEQPLLSDRVAYGGWGLDEHPSLGFFQEERINDHTHRGVLHSIPYRSLYSKNIDNLMMAGRNISVTHVALTGTRVMYTTGIIGQAAGMASGLAIINGTTPRGVYENHLNELQQGLLKTGAYMIQLPNQDPDDKALVATVTSSSGIETANSINNGYARATLSTAFPNSEFEKNAWIPDADDLSPWVQLNWAVPQKINVIHVVFQNRDDLAYKSFRIESKRKSKWETVKEVDNPSARRRLVIPVGDLNINDIRIVLNDNKNQAGICEIRVYDEPKDKVEQIKRANKVMDTPDGEILLPWQMSLNE